MKNIGITTLNGESNYGNRLQNYALQKAISQLGHEGETIVFVSRKAKLISLTKDALASALRVKHRRLDYWRMLKTKRSIFQPFSKKYIKSDTVKSGDDADLSNKYDLFITGSDQVWNPNYTKGSSTNFLTFAPLEKRTSYAASFGVSEIPTEYRESYMHDLNGMYKISVREQAGVEIVKALTNRDAELVPDPTILLSSDDWDDIIDNYADLANERYIFVYSLHSLDKETWKQINNHAKVDNLKAYQVMGDFYDSTHSIPNPAEFVARIKYAQAVYTDSFHACVFSIIMHTPFKVFERKDMKMASRLETLLATYSMQVAMQPAEIDPAEYNFELSDKIATKERARGMRYLSQLMSDGKVK